MEEALQGAKKDILAERISDQASCAGRSRNKLKNTALFSVKKRKKHEDENKVYKMYYDYKEKISTLANHRVMAIDRAEKEKVITVTLDYNQTFLINYAIRGVTHDRTTACQSLIEEAAQDGLKRLAFLVSNVKSAGNSAKKRRRSRLKFLNEC